MKINYYLSTTTKCATTLALKQVLKLAENDITENNIVIVPDTKSIIIERELLSLSQSKSLVNVFVYSFVRLLGRIGNVDSEKVLNKQSAILLLKNIILDNESKFECYKKSIKNVNFAEKIYETIQQLKSSNVSPEDLMALSVSNDSLSSKLKDLNLIYSEYEKATKGQFFDDCDKLNLLNTFAKSSEFVKNSNVFIVGFDNITNEMQDVLKSFATSAKSINFSAVYFNNRDDSYIQSNELYKKFKRIADELNYPYVPVFADAKFAGDYYFVAHNLFSTSAKEVKSKGNIKVFEAESKENEYRFVADKIMTLVKSGQRFKDFGVLDLELEKNQNLLCKVFDEYNINYFVNTEIDISNHYSVLLIKNVFEIFKSHLHFKPVLKLVKSCFFNYENADEFENFVIEYGLNYNDFLKEIDGKDFKIEPEKIEAINKILEKFGDFYCFFKPKFYKDLTCSDFVQICYEIINYFDFENKLGLISKFESENGLQKESQISLVVCEKIKETLKMIDNFVGNKQMTTDEFVELLSSCFGSQKINLVPLSIDSVIVQKDTDGFFDLKTLFICSASENNFPSSISDQGILLDDEITKTNLLCGKEIEPTTKQINDRTRFSAYESLLEPKENLFVSYNKTEIDGTSNKPSMIIQKLVKLFGKEIVLSNHQFENCDSRQNMVFQFASNIEKFYDKKCSLDSLSKQYNQIANGLDLNFKTYLTGLSQSEFGFQIDNAQNLFCTNSKISATQLESYFACPYKHFADYGLKLKENKVYKLSKMDVGVILHAIVENFVKQIKDFDNLSDGDFVKKVLNLTNDVLDELKINRKRNKVMISFLEKEAIKLCHYLFEEQRFSAFKPVALEQNFGDSDTIFNIVDGTKIQFVGKIDRIDKSGDYIRIIDYKTGNVDSNLSSIYYGKKIQLVSYLFAISKKMNKKIAGVLYFPIHFDYVDDEGEFENNYKMNGFLINDVDVLKNMDSNISFENPKSKFVPVTIKTSKKHIDNNIFEISRPGDKFLSEKQFESLKNYFKDLCENATNEFVGGYIEPAPFKQKQTIQQSVCDYCEYSGFCGLENSRFAGGRICDEKIKIEDFDKEED